MAIVICTTLYIELALLTLAWFRGIVRSRPQEW